MQRYGNLPVLRRVAISAVLLIAGAGVNAQSPVASVAEPHVAKEHVAGAHMLRLYNTHTFERIEIVYRQGDQYIPDALTKLNYFLRDNRNGSIRPLDPRLFDLLSDLTASVGHPGAEIDIICGYRTPSTNEALRALSSGVAKNSHHVQAEAIDIRIPGVDTLALRRAALAMHRGGVGYYPHHDFVHVDVGRVRQWCFNCPAELIPGD
jgi:uncharacterized protein YcbK (DUF882 family)